MNPDRRHFLTWLIVITITGCALRVFHLNEIPFTYDELSALNRTHFNSFQELIQQGVAPDGHPAGVQVFLYYWVKIFGDAEWVVKLPFILMGICCIPLIFLIGTRWFNRSAGIIAACFMAGLQYTVMYSQIARPYISGLFLILLLAAIWNSVMAKTTTRNLIAFAVVLALCAFNHYFSLLTAGGIVITGLFIIERRYLLKYMSAVVVSVVLCLPHMHLFFQQLQLKGLQWVSVPTPGFFKNYLYYIFNFSNYILVALALLFFQGLYFYTKAKPPVKLKYRIIALLWFVIPAAVGYFYSVYRAPVLQTSVLIFGFPFLLLFICSFFTLPDSYFRDLQIGLLLLVLVFSLGWERGYYRIFYHAETEMFARHISGFELAYGKNNVEAVVNTNPKYLDFYKKKYNTDWSYKTFEEAGNVPVWRKWLEKSDAQYLVLCNPPIEWGGDYLSVAREYFKCVDSIYYGFTTSIYILKREDIKCVAMPAPVFTNQIAVIDSNDLRHGYFYYGLSTDGLDEKMKLTLSVDLLVDSVVPQGSLFMSFGGAKIASQKRMVLFSNLLDSSKGWHSVYLTARLYHTPLSKTSKILYALDLAANPNVKFRNLKMEVIPDNPVFYALIKK